MSIRTPPEHIEYDKRFMGNKKAKKEITTLFDYVLEKQKIEGIKSPYKSEYDKARDMGILMSKDQQKSYYRAPKGKHELTLLVPLSRREITNNARILATMPNIYVESVSKKTGKPYYTTLLGKSSYEDPRRATDRKVEIFKDVKEAFKRYLEVRKPFSKKK